MDRPNTLTCHRGLRYRGSFVQVGRTGLWRRGPRCLMPTAQAGGTAGYVWINATNRATTTAGLTYYQSRGFRGLGL